MTIIVGIISDGEIVLASDSQTTSGTAKRCDTNKISLVEFANVEVLVAQAGYATFSGRAFEIFKAMAKGKIIADHRMIAELAEKSMLQMKNEARLQQGNCTMEELREFIWGHEMDCSFMLAYYFERKPFLFTLGMILGVANKVNSFFDAIGCGANLGGYLLSELSYPKMDSKLAAAVAVYVVESVKKHDAYCGGDTKVALLRQPRVPVPEVPTGYYPSPISDPLPNYLRSSPCKVFSKKEVENLVKIVSTMDNKTKKQRNNIIQKALLKEATNYFKSIKIPKRRIPSPVRRTPSSYAELLKENPSDENKKS